MKQAKGVNDTRRPEFVASFFCHNNKENNSDQYTEMFGLKRKLVPAGDLLFSDDVE